MTVDDVKKTLAEHGLLEFVEAECRRRNVPVDWVLGRERYADVVRARHEVWYAVRQTLGFSYPHIGRIFGVDHSTVLHACRRVSGLRFVSADRDETETEVVH